MTLWSSLVILILFFIVCNSTLYECTTDNFFFFFFTSQLFYCQKIFLWLQVPQGVCWFACSWPLQLLQLWEIPHAKIFWTLSIKWGNYWFALVALKFIIFNFAFIVRNASKFQSGTRLSEGDPISFRWLGIDTGFWSLVAISNVGNTIAGWVGAKYIPTGHHVFIWWHEIQRFVLKCVTKPQTKSFS